MQGVEQNNSKEYKDYLQSAALGTLWGLCLSVGDIAGQVLMESSPSLESNLVLCIETSLLSGLMLSLLTFVYKNVGFQNQPLATQRLLAEEGAVQHPSVSIPWLEAKLKTKFLALASTTVAGVACGVYIGEFASPS